MSGGAFAASLMFAFLVGASAMMVVAFGRVDGLKTAAIEGGCAQYDAKTGAFKWRVNP